MLIVVANARIEPRNRERMQPAGEAMVAASRGEAGCLGYTYAVDILDPEMWRIVELWKDAEALRFHFGTPHMAVFLAELAAMGNPRPEITVYEADNPHPISDYRPAA